MITTTIGWRWVFFVNAPVGLMAAFLIGRFLRERVEHRRHRLDLVGAGILTLGLVSLLFAATEGGQLWGWTSLLTLGLVAAAVALLLAFVAFERHIAEPLIDLGLLGVPVIAAGLAIGALVGRGDVQPLDLRSAARPGGHGRDGAPGRRGRRRDVDRLAGRLDRRRAGASPFRRTADGARRDVDARRRHARRDAGDATRARLEGGLLV